MSFGNLEMTAVDVADSVTRRKSLESTPGACNGRGRRRSKEENERSYHCKETNDT
jgi:hypothetical protein